jgi:hypothetical protein
MAGRCRVHDDARPGCPDCSRSATVIHSDPAVPVSALRAICEKAERAFRALHLVDFNERTQEFFCRVCRYRDPLLDGEKLHADHCDYVAVLAVLNELRHACDSQDTTVVLARRQCEAVITPAVEVSALRVLVKKWRDPAWFSTHGWDEYAYDVTALCHQAERKP